MKNLYKSMQLFFVFMSTIQIYAMDNEQTESESISTLQALLIAQHIAVGLKNRMFSEDELSHLEFKFIKDYAYLLKHALNKDICDHDGIVLVKQGYLLQKAVRMENLQMTSLLLAVGVKPHDESHGNLPLLHVAAECGNKRIAKLLLTYGVDVNKIDSKNVTPLHLASYHGHSAVAALLLDRGADVNSAIIATDKPFKFLEQEDIGWTPLHKASDKGHCDIAVLLLNRGAHINQVNDERCTALHKASEQGHYDVVQLLLERGADVDRKNYLGQTCYELARQCEQIFI